MSKETRKLSTDAYREVPGKDYQPYVGKRELLPEFTFRALFTGTTLGILFAAANAYIGLKVGLTVSASIPVAVMAVAIFRIIGKGSILENNMVQTVGSAGESLAAGVIFTFPALIIWGMKPELTKIFVFSLLGGWLGVLFMIPLRKLLISNQHGRLPYPEGTACAEVLVAGDKGGTEAKTVFLGLAIGSLYEFLMNGLKLWNSRPSWEIPFYKGAKVPGEITPALLGVGYIIGPRISAIMLSGGALAWLVIIPLITAIGESATKPLFPSEILISQMSIKEIWHSYIRYIGAGAVAFGGLITLIRTLPTIFQTFRTGIKSIRIRGKDKELKIRTDRDLSLLIVVFGVAILAICLWLVLVFWTDSAIPTALNLVVAFLMIIFSFFFVTVSSRIVGLIGSSSNPVSGMTITTLLLTSLVFLIMGWTTDQHLVIALSVGAVVCISIAIAGDTSQDLKTGFLIGATPWKQQMGEFIGVLTSAIFVGWIILRLHKGMEIGSEALPAPQATLMSLVVKGVITGELPWNFVIMGIFLAAIVELVGVRSLPFAVGLYLPLYLTTPIMAGGFIRYLTERKSKEERLKRSREKGVLFSSGLIAGSALIGVGLALMASYNQSLVNTLKIGFEWMGSFDMMGSLLIFTALAVMLWSSISGRDRRKR
ncbi:MAG: oligopeptide transporter, OPT family [Candidatus Scalindua sp. AMX11]|nr:MAG: oligopeptide transporter, OPT family [Candidatus Scalindua sp.]NOG83541.1 oligopeptide transporter, OPT family [Planctomycetota bacterium]RZV72054.1 MAG: oligopeptide transporter, OPT family [Candidatus Scalindua sp. SCAELEC01]TDE64395.1 MAG: oligopeptide transporter, OPT family [Candidatus Scalindua sp. AMX11]GJQ59856.1 MAG: oligopeptide transporter, OPT family protein [Candidatus Scalindua sp.]